MNFEAAPFKLTQEYIDILGGSDSGMFMYFKTLLLRGLDQIRHHLDELIDTIKIMSCCHLLQERSSVMGFSETAPQNCMPCVRDVCALEKEIRSKVSCVKSTYLGSSGYQDKTNELQVLVNRLID